MPSLTELGLTIEDIAPSLVQALGVAQLQAIVSQVALLKLQQPPPVAAVEPNTEKPKRSRRRKAPTPLRPESEAESIA